MMEQQFLASAMAAVIQRAARRSWSKLDFYNELTADIYLTGLKLSDQMEKVITRTIEDAQFDTNIVKVTHRLIMNIRDE